MKMSSQKRKSFQDLSQKSKKLKSQESFNSTCNGQRAGTIDKVCLLNFMCHENFEINLNKHITYVVGKNGSGKSAILTSVILALGGRASATNRGNSVKEFIKKGEHRASIEIYLYNAGLNAYKPEIFGDEICVIRTFNLEGTSSYKLKNNLGKIVANGKDEIEKMVLYFNIQVDNPIAILNQDTARTFLVSNNPKDKYLLLMRATQLHYIKHIYEEIEQDIKITFSTISQKNKSLEQAKREIEKLAEKYTLMQTVKEQIKQREVLKKELEWSQIIQLETDYSKLNDSFKNIEKELEKFNNEIQIRITSSEEHQNKMETFSKEEKELLEKYNILDSKLSTCSEEEQNKKEILMQKQNAFRINENDIKKFCKMIQTLKNEIAKNHQEELQGLEKKRERKQEINVLEEKMENIIARTKTTSFHRVQISSNLKRIEEILNPINDKIRHLEQKYRNIKTQLLQMQKHNDNLSVFGPFMNDLVQHIEVAYQKGLFKKKPIGPLGIYIKVKDSSWIPAIEYHLRSFLTSFLCDNANDFQQLKKICQRNVKQGIKIFVSKMISQRHNIKSEETFSDNCQSFIGTLDISDTNVFNLLIDQASLESILLIDKAADARHLLCDSNRVPVNCKKAITKKGDVYFPDPNYKTYAGPKHLQVRFLQEDRTEALKSLKQEQSELESKISVEKQKGIQTKEEISKESIELNKINKLIQDLEDEKYKIRLKLKRLYEEEENERDAPLIDSMNTEIEELEDKLNRSRSKCQELENSLKEAKEIHDEYLNKTLIAQQEIKSIRKEFDLCRNKKEEARKTFDNFDKHIIEMKKKKEHAIVEKNKIISLIKQKKVEIEKQMSKASSLGERIQTERDFHEINSELKKLNSYITSHESFQGTYEEVANEYISKLEKFKEVSKEVKKLNKYHKFLQTNMGKRDEIYKKISKYILLNVQFMFTIILNQRGYSGRLDIDHTKETLDIVIDSSKHQQMLEKEVRSLSGGERSFYTVALILAIWGNISCPFYIMDEFDVFMDKVNRTACLDLLMEHARLKEGNQFIFLTPQNTSSIQETDELSIERLENPRG